jgi:hypothetical protein
VPARHDAHLRDHATLYGWARMIALREAVRGGIAAVADGERTRFASLGGTQLRGAQLLAPVLEAIGRRAGPVALRRFTVRVESLRR